MLAMLLYFTLLSPTTVLRWVYVLNAVIRFFVLPICNSFLMPSHFKPSESPHAFAGSLVIPHTWRTARAQATAGYNSSAWIERC
ncbi:hypothetical protein BV25DRAFT_1275482 [Artomyces pyxidatus]|uniref:Uncharacterized protein n=1 Tax=Artomyces pyxidatus TaxID=48021 RepID=A0ACB8TF56_9AGAM|nr:hypothetical protein BV25DRAFT_1275482 [Artomyces pyxidatus]